jgi:hypothetical protein
MKNQTGWIPLLLQVVLVVQPVAAMLNMHSQENIPMKMQEWFGWMASGLILLAVFPGLVSPFLKRLTPAQRWIPAAVSVLLIWIIKMLMSSNDSATVNPFLV